MKTILIIGAGQLGSRHLQGLVAVTQPLSIHLLDPSAASLQVARGRFAEVDGHQRHVLAEHTDPSTLPGSVDFAISATTANYRLASLEAVLERTRIGALLLEKVLFQKPSEYEKAIALLDREAVPTWVNCARRLFPIYSEIKQFFGDEAPKLLQVEGGAWGLGCNGIHFVDLFQFLSGTTPERYETASLDPVLHASKREAFREFSGLLVGVARQHRIELSSDHDSTRRHLLAIRSDSRTVLVDETARVARFLDERDGWTERSFDMPFQSALTGRVATDVLAGRDPGLPTLRTSVAAHLPFVQALLQHANTVSGRQDDSCPIT